MHQTRGYCNARIIHVIEDIVTNICAAQTKNNIIWSNRKNTSCRMLFSINEYVLNKGQIKTQVYFTSFFAADITAEIVMKHLAKNQSKC